MRAIFFVFTFICFAAPIKASAESTALDSVELKLKSGDAEAALDAMAGSLGSVFKRYRPNVPSDFTVMEPLTVGGSASQPELKMKLRKCMMIACEDVQMKGVVKIKEITSKKGVCTKRYGLSMDLSRSDKTLSNAYNSLNVDICYTEVSNGNGTLTFTPVAQSGPGADMITHALRPVILNFLNLQVRPITRAVQTNLQAYKPKASPTPAQPEPVLEKRAELEDEQEPEYLENVSAG